jgi:RHS repeat-associated protein
VSATSGTTTSLFSYDTQTRPGQPLVIDDGTNAYIYGPGDFGAGTAPLEQIALSTNMPSYLFNAPSGVEAFVNSSGTTVAGYTYAPYGTKTTGGTSGLTPFGFQGGYTDPTGLIYFINRYYDPSTDQFISVDPLVAMTGQPYAFTGDDPLNAVDPLGLSGAQIANMQYQLALNRHKKFCAAHPGILGHSCGGLLHAIVGTADKVRHMSASVLDGVRHTSANQADGSRHTLAAVADAVDNFGVVHLTSGDTQGINWSALKAIVPDVAWQMNYYANKVSNPIVTWLSSNEGDIPPP